MNDSTEQTAQKIAARGREALVMRLRPAFEEAAAAHADVLELGEGQLEQMVQRAADRADGLQWRRALAAVATEELGISLGEALSHPAVERAQAIVGAPSYEESLASLGPLPASEAAPAARVHEESAEETEEEVEEAAEPEAEENPEEVARRGHDAEGDEPEEEQEEPEAEESDEDEEEEPERDEEATGAHEVEPEEDEEATGPHEVEPDEPSSVRLAAVHLGGIANLAPAESDIQLEFSEDGLDIVRGSQAGSDAILGRLGWEDVRALEVPDPQGWRLRRRQQTHLVVRTDHGDASFEIPALSAEELREHLEPVRRYM